MSSLVSRFLKDKSAATAVEYALIAAGIAVAIIAGINGVAGAINSRFGFLKNTFN